LADVSSASWTPSTDPERIPEVRHNLHLIADVCKSDLDGLAREAKALEERKKWLVNEDLRLRKKVEEEAGCESISCFFSQHDVRPTMSLQ
jgi:tuftelin-interacting protein 11